MSIPETKQKRKKYLTKIKAKSIAYALAQTKAMNQKQKEAEIDLIFKNQPNLLSSVIVLHNMGRSHKEIEILLNVLLVSFLALRHGKNEIVAVSEELLERELSRYAGHLKFLDGLSAKNRVQAMSDYIEAHDEKFLLAFVIDQMNKAGFQHIEEDSAKYLMSCGLNIVNCISATELV